MLPADKRFRPYEHSGGMVVLRLIINGKLLVPQSGSHHADNLLLGKQILPQLFRIIIKTLRVASFHERLRDNCAVYKRICRVEIFSRHINTRITTDFKRQIKIQYLI